MTTGSIRIAMTSDVGLRRKNNQDTGFAQQGVFMVCDGMGGGKGGEQASQLAAQHFAQLAAMPSRTRQDIDDTLARAQHDILDLGDRLGGVAGTTCSGLVLPQDHADSTSARSAALFSDADDQDFSDQTYVVNVGDSRTYHLSPLAHADAPATDIIPVWDAASLIRITRDHIEYFLLRLRDLDVKDRECQKRLVQTFVNAVFIYDDGRVKITYNYSGQSSTITLNQIASAEKGKGFVCCLPCSTSSPRFPRGVAALFLFLGKNGCESTTNFSCIVQ